MSDETISAELTEKRCPKCETVKPASAFHANPARRTGLSSWCKGCSSTHYYQTDRYRARRREYNNARRYLPQNLAREKRAAANRTYDSKKECAKKRLQSAVARGHLNRPSVCEGCGLTPVRTLHGHHHKGYDYPLDVQWLCTLCHAEAHRCARLEGK